VKNLVLLLPPNCLALRALARYMAPTEAEKVTQCRNDSENERLTQVFVGYSFRVVLYQASTQLLVAQENIFVHTFSIVKFYSELPQIMPQLHVSSNLRRGNPSGPPAFRATKKCFRS